MAAKSKTNTPPGVPAEQHIRLRVICQKPPSPQQHGAEFGLQDNSSTNAWMLHEGQPHPNGDIHFACECRIRPGKDGAPNFLGPFVHGSAMERFLYLSWRPRAWYPGQPEPAHTWVRRIKVHLKSVTWEQIDDAIKKGGVLEATVAGTGRDGGPSCASVPLIGGGWKVRMA